MMKTVSKKTAEAMETQAKEYAQLLRNAKVTVMDSSILRYQLQKFCEAALAGTLIVSDLPLQDEEVWSKVVIQVSVSDSDQKLVDTALWWATHDKERLEHVRQAQQLVANKYTYMNTIQLLLQAYDRWTQQRYGVWFPYPFSIGCASKDNKNHPNQYCLEN